MMRKLFTASLLALVTVLSSAQQGDGALEKYRRSSICSIKIGHSDYPYAAEIDSAFLAMPLPDKYNDHNLDGITGFESSATDVQQKGAAKDRLNKNDIGIFFEENDIAKKLVAKWFNRDSTDGGFNMNLIQERGFYDASALDIETALSSERGLSRLGDAGEELIANTFVVVNDITFVDKGETSSSVAGGIALLGGLVGAITGDKDIAAIGVLTAAAVNEIDGFKVNITSYLYQLDWNEETEGTFYKNYWFPAGTQNEEKKAAFEAADCFKLKYVGASTSQASNLSSKSFGKTSKSDQMLIVCARAVDNSIAQLQKSYPVFRVNVPLYSIAENKKTVEVKIGLKEGVSEQSQYEVLMPVESNEGKLSYQRVGMIKPVKESIWDNRFGALENAQAAVESGAELAAKDEKEIKSALLTATTFKVLSGGNRIEPGYLVREVK